jgi:integrase
MKNDKLSKASKETYMRLVWRFLKCTTDKELTIEKVAGACKALYDETRADPKRTIYVIMEWVDDQKARMGSDGITGNQCVMTVSALKSFFANSGVKLDWTDVRISLPRMREVADDRGYTREEIKRLCQYPDRRVKVIVLLMASGGLRVGAVVGLNWGDVKPLWADPETKRLLRAASVRVYRGEREEYEAFITPECYYAIKDYMDYRAANGEKITDESPLVRDILGSDRGGRGVDAVPKRLNDIADFVWRVVKADPELRGKRSGGAHNRRYEVKTNHALRKFFRSYTLLHMTDGLSNGLLGHMDSYNKLVKTDPKAALDRYCLAVPDLTILTDVKLSLESAGIDIDKMVREHDAMKEALERINLKREGDTSRLNP